MNVASGASQLSGVTRSENANEVEPKADGKVSVCDDEGQVTSAEGCAGKRKRKGKEKDRRVNKACEVIGSKKGHKNREREGEGRQAKR